MKPVLTSAALAAAMFLPAAFAQEPPPSSDTPTSGKVILQGTPEAAAAAQADANRASTDLVAAKTNGEPVAAEVAAVVQSGKKYTTDDLVRAQRAAMHLDPGPSHPAARTEPNATKSPGPNTAVFDRVIATDKASSITASATDAKIPNQPAKPATAENTVKPEAPPPVDQPNSTAPLSTPDSDTPEAPAPK